MDLKECRTVIDGIDEAITANLIQRSEYSFGSGFSIKTGNKAFYDSLLQHVCPSGNLEEHDLPIVSEIERGLKTSLDLRFSMAENIINYKKHHHMNLEDAGRESEIINKAGRYAASEGKDPEPCKKAFRLIIEHMKQLEMHNIAAEK